MHKTDVHEIDYNEVSRYQLRQAAGAYWLLDMSQSGEHFKKPMQLNETGARLYKGLAAGKTVDELAQELAEQYEMPAEELRGDVEAFKEELCKQGVLR